MKKTLLLDGDELVFKYAAACEQEVRWDDANHVIWSNPDHVWENLVAGIKRLLDRFEVRAKDAVVTFSGTYGDTPNFRLAIDETYKSHRAESRKPMCYWEVRERAEKAYKTVVKSGLEADDVMGILATKPDRKTQAIICSRDKDMKTLPATVWNGVDLITYSVEEADRFHLYQTLIGDTADGYKGCPGIGPVKAEKILDLAAESLADKYPHNTIRWARVVAAFEKAGLTEADALKQARLARILRWTDWDHEKKEPILWTPTRVSSSSTVPNNAASAAASTKQ